MAEFGQTPVQLGPDKPGLRPEFVPNLAVSTTSYPVPTKFDT